LWQDFCGTKKLDSVLLNKVIVIECAFPNIEISLRIFLTLMITNCKTERSFSQMNRLENLKRTTMRREDGILISAHDWSGQTSYNKII
jgi:hypothetical protein